MYCSLYYYIYSMIWCKYFKSNFLLFKLCKCNTLIHIISLFFFILKAIVNGYIPYILSFYIIFF